MRRILVAIAFAAMAVGCDERELLNHSAKVPIGKSISPADAHTVIVRHSGFVAGGVVSRTSEGALRALGSPLPREVLVLACANVEYKVVHDLLQQLKEQGIATGFASAQSAQCSDVGT